MQKKKKKLSISNPSSPTLSLPFFPSLRSVSLGMADMAGHSHSLILILLFPLFLVTIKGQSPYYSCPESALTYKTNSKFERHLNQLLASLTANVAPTGFYNDTVGNGRNQVHGLVQCHPDVSADDCKTCATSAASQIIQVCPSKKMAVIWFDNCLLRYNSFNFFGIVDQSKLALVNVEDIYQPTKFKPLMLSVFRNLAASATTNSSSLRYATATVAYTKNITLYSLMECTRDLSSSSCSYCLRTSLTSIYQCCSDKQGARVLSGSCVIRYEIYPFFGNVLPPSAGAQREGRA
ncbi:cysteine-rich repeat secretory protein 38-like [Nymphaea colorata]|nr:cysteine-rich repeat secretory protein 38-like [Nymphaea colorata]